MMGLRDLLVKKLSSGVGGSLQFELPSATRASVTGEYKLFLNSSGALIFDNGSTQTTIGAAGSGGIPTWEAIFTADNTFTITADTTFTIAGNRSTATNVLTLTNVGGGSGHVLQITNSGSGKDINGTSDTWNVSKAGAATFLTVALTGTTLTSTDNNAWTLKDNSSTALVIGASGSTAILTVDTSDAAPLVKFGNGISLTDGNATFISTSNTVTNVLVTNNTITTFGANASSAGVVCIRSTSLTTGSLLMLQLSDTNNAGGFYLTCRESVGGTNDFTIGENGVIVMAGTAASDSLTVTAGDVVLSDGSLTMTDADDAASLSITNDTATTASVFVFAGSGAFTGNTTSSFATLTASGLTTGTMLYMAAAALTTGKVINITATAATDGILMTITGGGANMTATGGLITLAMGAATVGAGIRLSTTGVYTGAGLIQLTANSATTGVVTQITANGLTTGNALNVSSSGTVTSSGTGVVVVTASGLTTGYGVQITDGGSSNTLTSGTMLRVYTNSSDTTARGVVTIVQDHASATGAVPILITQDGVSNTNYRKLIKETATGITIWMGNGTGANGVLTGTAGDILINGASNKPEYCTGTSVWVALV